MLKSLCLPDFDESNWTSVIRNKVSVCDRYHDLEPWTGRFETSDIIYTDDDGSLRDALTARGYLSPGLRVRVDATYFFEVKTTTGECNTPFTLTSSQCRQVSSTDLF